MRLISPTIPGGRTPLVSSAQRLTVGRDPAADWTLPDPARLLSRLHFEITNDVDGVFAHDRSANGLVVNSAVAPIGKGKKVALEAGDLLRFGPYVAEVLIAETTAAWPNVKAADETTQLETGEDRAARLAALAAFAPDLAEGEDSAATEYTTVLAPEVADCSQTTALSSIDVTSAPQTVSKLKADPALESFGRPTPVLIPEDWYEERSHAGDLSHQKDRSVSNLSPGDARLTALDALAKLACAVDPESQGHPYTGALHHYTLTGRIAFQDIRNHFDVLNQKVLRLLAEQASDMPIGGSDSARPTLEH